MSLLMDALKKAEQEKKEAAKRLKEAQSQAGEELDLAKNEPGDLTTPPELTASNSPIEKADVTAQAKISDTGPDALALEAIEISSGNDEHPEKTDQVEDNVDITIEHPELSNSELSIAEEIDELKEPEKSTINPNQTFALTDLSIEDSSEREMSFEDTVQTDKPDEIYDTISESRTVTSVISAAELARDIGTGKDNPTPVAAQTVFTAVGSGSEKESYKWATFLVLCIVVAASLSVIYYYKVVPITVESSSPLVAQGIEVNPATLPAVEIPEEILKGAIITDQSSNVRQSETDMETEVTLGEEQDDAISLESELPDEPVQKETGVIDSIIEILPEGEKLATILPSLSDDEIPTEDIVVDPAVIKISRSKTKDEQEHLINSAYAEYNRGNYEQAEIAYHNVLKIMPDNRDALLGLAAIAYKNGKLQKAYTGYQYVLKLYPKDSVARSALISMQNINKPVQSESMVKLMLQQEPKAAFLYFTLGNIYAAQARWPEAQQAFFDAHRHESNNPDYAFNLAVSLDHIGQTRTALDYYNVALGLADDTNVNFNTAVLLSRIKTLSAVANSN